MVRIGKSGKKEKDDFGFKSFFSAIKDIIENVQFTKKYSKGKGKIKGSMYDDVSIKDSIRIKHIRNKEVIKEIKD